MPPTSEPGGPATVLISGLDSFDLQRIESDVTAAARIALLGQRLIPPDGAEISIAFVDDATIGGLNRDWLDRAGPTDVIAFSLGEDPLVADVYVSVETARRNAERFGVTAREELLRLVVHGVLHVTGHDHPVDAGRGESDMFALQERLVRQLLDDLRER